VRSEALKAALTKIQVFWDMHPTTASEDRSAFIFGVMQSKKRGLLYPERWPFNPSVHMHQFARP